MSNILDDEPIIRREKLYRVTVPYTEIETVEVKADSEAEAIAKAMVECPVDDGVDPLTVCHCERGERRYHGWGSSWHSDADIRNHNRSVMIKQE
jgi:hypothetical protein